MKLFVPSKDRASQLHCLVESVRQNLPNVDLDIHVLYTTSRKEFSYGYDKFIELNPSVTMEYEACFESDFNEYLKHAGSELVMLLTDDCVFYRKDLADEWMIDQLMKEKVWCFSYRLGLNTTTQWYRTGSQQNHLSILGYEEIQSGGEKYIGWNWKIRPAFENYGYMVSWDASIYRASDLLELSNKFSFYNPRTFEDKATKVTEYRNQNPRKYMFSPALSSVFVNTINNVQEESPPFGEKYTMSPEELNKRYLDGEVIDVATFDGLQMSGSHDEIPLKFRKV